MKKRAFLPLFLLAASAWAQTFSAGVKVGIPLTDLVNPVRQSTSVTNRYLVGPTAELRLPFGLGVEVDAIYRHFRYQAVLSTLSHVYAANTTGEWEFPVLLKYRFPSKRVRPYVVGGIAWDKISHEPTYSLETKNTTTGLVIGAGLDAHFAVHIMPELRYTHWTSQHFDPAASFILNGNQNQVEVMVGITF